MDIEITSLSKKPEQAGEAAAAVHVITREDIRRSGATTVAEALRLAPGVQACQANADLWAVSIRGFTDYLENKLLVLVDGRSVYNPFWSGTHWGLQDMLLEDIERIEVIRGPGGATWGANAVNGVINIITRNASDTQGGYAMVGAGSVEDLTAGLRYGMPLGDQHYLRLYGKGFERDGLDEGPWPSDFEWSDPAEDWREGRAGFRLDSYPDKVNTFSLQGSFFSQAIDQAWVEPGLTPPFTERLEDVATSRGGFVMGQWEHALSADATCSLKAYYDYSNYERHTARIQWETLDVEFVHNWHWGARQEITWGLGYRVNRFELDESFRMAMGENPSEQQIASAFLQDEIRFFDERLRLTLGCRIEDNSHATTELHPNARLSWVPGDRFACWASAARTVRAPSRIDRDFLYRDSYLYSDPATGLPILLAVRLDDEFEPEKLKAYECGFRLHPIKPLWFDVSAFINDYDGLRSYSSSFNVRTDPSLHGEITAVKFNDVAGRVRGFEATATWQARPWCRFEAAYSLLSPEFEDKVQRPPNSDAAYYEGIAIQHQTSLRASLDLPRKFEFDLWARYAGEIRIYDYESYWATDARVGWRPRSDLSFSVTGKNLFDSRHRESSNLEVRRSVYFQAEWRF